jgi:hypothetical protein
MSKRWTYQVVEIKPSLMGRVNAESINAELNRQGGLGWELVQVLHNGHGLHPAKLIFKKEL